nr:phosphate-binding protein [Endozoicomonas sp.]
MKITKLMTAFKLVLAVSATAAFTAAGAGSAMASQLDSSLPTYQKSSGVSGNLSSVGSDTLANLM